MAEATFWCKRCGEDRPVAEYMSDLGWCKSCVAEHLGVDEAAIGPREISPPVPDPIKVTLTTEQAIDECKSVRRAVRRAEDDPDYCPTWDAARTLKEIWQHLEELGGCLPKVPRILRYDDYNLQLRALCAVAEKADEISADDVCDVVSVMIEKCEESAERALQARGIEADAKQDTQGGQEDSRLLSVKELAKHHGVDPGILRHRLERWRKNHGDGWSELTNRRRNESRYVYYGPAVMHIIEAIKTSNEPRIGKNSQKTSSGK